MNRQSWHDKQDQAIRSLVDQYGCDDWSKISSQLTSKYQFTRTGKQCRQRWYNHLDPKVSKKAWTQNEELFLFQKHKQIGNHWKQISKHLEGRTDNDVKNHFYSTLRRSLRRLNKGMGKKNSTSQMRQIKPSVLSTMMKIIYAEPSKSNAPQGQHEEYTALKALPLMIFEYSNYKPIKSQQQLTSQLREKYMDILDILNRFNEQYQKDKSQYKKMASGKKQPSKNIQIVTKTKSKKNNLKNRTKHSNLIQNLQEEINDQSLLKRSQSLKQQSILQTLIHQSQQCQIKENHQEQQHEQNEHHHNGEQYEHLHLQNENQIELVQKIIKERRISLQEDQFEISSEHYHHYENDGIDQQEIQSSIEQEAYLQYEERHVAQNHLMENFRVNLIQQHRIFTPQTVQITQSSKQHLMREDFLNQVLQLG